MYELLGILFMNIGSMKILRKAKGKKGNLQSGIMGIMWKARGKMVNLHKVHESSKEGPYWPCDKKNK